MIIKKNIFLKKYTTFKIGGRAEYFCETENKTDLLSAIKLVKEKKMPFFVLGKGSNLLVSSKGVRGLVLSMQNAGYNLQGAKIYSGSGTSLALLVQAALKHNLTGLEWAIGIPGSLGGAIYGNAGAFKKSIGDDIEEVEVFDVREEKIKIFKNKDCKFNYRNSIFKNKRNLIIISAKLSLKRNGKKDIQKKMKEFSDYRRNNQPLNFPSAGSVFKNPLGFSAGELIEKCGLKGKRIGNVKISEKHANFIVNLGNGKATDVIKLINLIKKTVKNKFKIKLKEEIHYLGEF